MTFISEFTQLPIKTITNPHPEIAMQQTHIITLPELCPRTQNPAKGSTLEIEYQAKENLLELFALEAYIKGFIGHLVVRDIEYFVQVVGMECAKALDNKVKITTLINLNGLAQQQKIVLEVDKSN